MAWYLGERRTGRGQLADSGARGLPRPDGREPSRRGAAAMSAHPRPQAASPAATHPDDRARENWPVGVSRQVC